MKMYLVSKQYYDEFVIFGLFSEDALDAALTSLAQEKKHAEHAQQRTEELKKWYEYHLDYFKLKCKRGCKHYPEGLKLSPLEFSKSLFGITELTLNEIIETLA